MNKSPAICDEEFASENIENKNRRCYYFNSDSDLLLNIEKIIKPTEVVLDIGCGINPINYFTPKLHIMAEPWQEYSDFINFKFRSEKNVIVMTTGAIETLKNFADHSVDSIFLIDVIEHIAKDIGFEILKEVKRVVREQVVIFTPLGFMPQHIESNQTDAWGLSGIEVQEHISGWLPKDFDNDWIFYICENFHKIDHKGEKLEKPYGAFFAILNVNHADISPPKKFPTISLPTILEAENKKLRNELMNAEAKYIALLNSRGVKLIRLMKNCLKKVRAIPFRSS